ncbi:MAG: ATP synthase F1 subunit delta [Acidobacteriota bacterium]
MTSKAAAIRYARALFDVALKEQADLDQIDEQLATFVELFTRHPTLAKVLLNPAVPVPRKRATVTELTTRLQTTPILRKLLTLLAERDRLVVLPDLLASYRDRLLDHRHIVRAEITTAVALSDDRARAIETRLTQVTGKTVTVTSRVDPGIIGGLIARIGSIVYDASVTRQLEKIRTRLVEGA